MSDIEKRIGGKITEIRLSQGLTQAQLAEKINVCNETISRMERGVAFPSLKTIDIIAKALNVPIRLFFEFEKGKAKNKLYERELSKLISFLRTRNKKEIMLVNKTSKVLFNELDKF